MKKIIADESAVVGAGAGTEAKAEAGGTKAKPKAKAESGEGSGAEAEAEADAGAGRGQNGNGTGAGAVVGAGAGRGQIKDKAMIVTPVPHNMNLGVSLAPRSPGLHLSTIYNDLYQDLEPARFVRGEPTRKEYLELGLSFETILEEGLKRRLTTERPGEFISEEGITISPDLLLFNDVTRVGEIKLTWLSMHEMPQETASRLPPKFDKWVTQIQGYCHVLRTPYARLWAFFVNGDYRPPQPTLRAWDLTFSAQELQENWCGLLNHARHKRML